MQYHVVYATVQGINATYSIPCVIPMRGESAPMARAEFQRIFRECFGSTLVYEIVAIIPEGSNATIYAPPYNGRVV